MVDIRHRVVVGAPMSRVYEAVSTPEGLSGWWTRDGVRGDATEGSRLEFFFGMPAPAAVMEVTGRNPDGRVSWECVDGADEWIGTKLSFDLKQTADGTVVNFTHGEWRGSSEFMAHCSARWAYFLLSLKSLVESGRGTPFPEDLKF
jgi:uncharacterized protein YndB with AHSA1/START domain